MRNNRLAMFLLGATLALGFAFSAHLLGGALIKMRQENLIRVKGVAEEKIKSNWAKWRCEIYVRASDMKLAYTEMEKANEITLKNLTGKGINKDLIKLQAITICTLYKQDARGNRTNEVDKYAFTQGIEIETTDVELIDRVSKSVTDLIKDGIEISSSSPVYIYTDIEKLKIELLAKATRNAYERALALANNSNGKLGSLASASQGVFQITPVNSTETTDYGAYDTTTIEKSVKAVVTLEFHLLNSSLN